VDQGSCSEGSRILAIFEIRKGVELYGRKFKIGEARWVKEQGK
jgi:hypothetical protein